ncbi:MAG: helix-turn-helix transcriptional regulator [Pseudolabrys sp.]|nr:helix-turn-helix transcriptional regulator [Pseudolabrys sp.]
MNQKTFGERLRLRLEALNMTNVELAKRSQISERSISHYLTGRSEPNLAGLVRIAKAAGTTPNELLGVGTEPEKSDKVTGLKKRLLAASDMVPVDQLEALVVQAEALSQMQTRPKRPRKPR